MHEWSTNNNSFKMILIIDYNRKSILKKILNIVQLFIVDIFIIFEKN